MVPTLSIVSYQGDIFEINRLDSERNSEVLFHYLLYNNMQEFYNNNYDDDDYDDDDYDDDDNDNNNRIYTKGSLSALFRQKNSHLSQDGI